MMRPAVAAMYARRGNLVQWLHTVTPNPGTLDASTGVPRVTLGGPRPTDVGNFGEAFLAPVWVYAYFSNKTTDFSQQPYGNVDIGDAQLTFAVPYVQKPGGTTLSDVIPPTLADYNEGNFADIRGETTLRMDRFIVNGLTYVAKAVAVPLVDRNVVFAWRVLVAKVSV